MKTNIPIILFIFLLLGFSCSEEEVIGPTERYLKIYDDRIYNASYDPIGLVETETGASLVLTEINLTNSSFSGSSIIRIDSVGDISNTTTIAENFVAPVGNLVTIGSMHYFASMDEQSLLVHLIPVASDGTVGDPIPVNSTLRYPLALSKTRDDRLLLLSYDPNNRLSVISTINVDGTVAQSQGYSVGAANDIEPIIFNHFTDPSSALTFFVGETSEGLFYFNGFYNFTLSLVFTNFGDDPTGVVQGQQSFTGIRSVLHLSGSTFTLMGYQFDRNFLRPQATLSTNSISSSVDLFASAIPEVMPNAPSKSILISREGLDDVIVTATETQSRQTILYFHSTDGVLLGIERLGSLNPFTFGDIIATADGGLKVLGTTFLASRFERIYLSRLSADEINRIAN
ncbi:MAG: hypothetical protein AAFQ94_00520 [Bacteroidota bacterium]